MCPYLKESALSESAAELKKLQRKERRIRVFSNIDGM